MSITARLLGSVRLPGGEALVNGFAFEGRAGAARRAQLPNGHELDVYDLDDLLAGERAPVAVFPAPWKGWGRGVDSVSPDGTFAVFSGQRAVRAVDADGATLWEYRHGCWGSEIGHPHTGDEQQVCSGLEHGSCRVSDDGRLVWAHVTEGDGDAWQEVWVVLDARDGRELARLPLEDSAASGSYHVSHPDGVHMGLGIGMGQDGCLVYWGRWDGERLTTWDLNEGLDRVLFDVHPGHAGFLTMEHYGADLQLHALDGTVLSEAPPPDPDRADGAGDEDGDEGDYQDEDGPEVPEGWDWSAGFVDADTVIACTGLEYGEEEFPRHWLLDAHTLEIRGAVRYPSGRTEGYARPLGDGTWLTYARSDEALSRWGTAPRTPETS
ncbi:hypothetical protein ACFUJR_28880 [Streptomyces sp. NPDC057271]|uniref:hypothetical protein n=1 Tax=unclassified Streptomyces TaxID=2593676 RepID=UPI0036401B31